MKWFLVMWVLTPLGPMHVEYPQDTEKMCRAMVATMDIRERHLRNRHAIIYTCREHEPVIIEPYKRGLTDT